MIASLVRDLLSRRLGLAAESLGQGAIEAAVAERVGHGDPQAWYERLITVPAELDRLIEVIVVPETWFFRDRRPFASLAAFARSRNPATVRVLSLPCSTGEEPYSIAIALLEAGFLPERIRVDAFDVSEKALERCRRGTYGQHSFRGEALEGRERWFVAESPGVWSVGAEPRRCVTFERGNAVDAALLAGRGPYDAIFCRNLLIYLDRKARETVVANLTSRLAPAGRMYMGHAEHLEPIDPRFRMVGEAGAFAYAATAPEGAVRQPTPARAVRRRTTATPMPAPSVPAPQSSALAVDPLATARDLANRGLLAEAAGICERLVREAPRAEVFSLLGHVRSAAGDWRQAEASFTKALYLDADHYEALVQMTLVCERRGESDAADRFRRRAERAAKARPARSPG